MRRLHAIIIAAGFLLILGSEIVYTVLLATPAGIRIRSPEGNVALSRSFVVSGDAWMKKGIVSIRVEADPRNRALSQRLVVAAERDTVLDRGRPLFALSTWNATVELPVDGSWSIRAVATAVDGTEVASSARDLSVRAGVIPREFKSWGAEHLIPFVIVLLGAVALGLLARGAGPARAISPSPRFYRIALWLTVIVWLNESAYQLYWFLVGGWSVSTALMLQMCGLSILLQPIMLLSTEPRTRQRLFDVLYFWAIGGALQALIAPDIGANGFPAYKYFSFFLSHGLIIAMAMVMALAGGVRITARSLLRAFIVTNILLVPIYGIDQALRLIPPYDPGNYFVLGFPPPTGSIVDLFSQIFGPSPRYVIGLELMGLAIFAVLYVPWPIARAIARRRNARIGMQRAPQ
jgi:hypothetical integral membrane protein (TIGR02206 family)